eukprot:1891437-Pyramimonas_sp.AAC.1
MIWDPDGTSACPPLVTHVGNVPDQFPQHERCQDLESTPCLQICMAFASVLTLQNTSKGMRPVGAFVTGRPRLFAVQFKLQGLGVAGAAETRMPFPGWANIGSYLVLHGPRHDSGSHGCSLWLRRGLQLVPGGPGAAISRQRLLLRRYQPCSL